MVASALRCTGHASSTLFSCFLRNTLFSTEFFPTFQALDLNIRVQDKDTHVWTTQRVQSILVTLEQELSSMIFEDMKRPFGHSGVQCPPPWISLMFQTKVYPVAHNWGFIVNTIRSLPWRDTAPCRPGLWCLTNCFLPFCCPNYTVLGSVEARRSDMGRYGRGLEHKDKISWEMSFGK